jgi:hypothetical protein
MSSDDPQTGREELQFDRVETTSTAADASAPAVASPAVICEMCGKSVGFEYFHVNDKPFCASCRDILLAAAKTPRTAGPLLRAGLFGLGAAIAGAAIYYAVIAITNFEIGLVAILIGYMVGWTVRRGAGGRGGRRFQVLALGLTYWAVGLAYTPLAFKELTGDDKSAEMLSDSSTVDSATPDTAISFVPPARSERAVAPTDSESAGAEADEPMTGRKFLIALGMTFIFVFALPIMSIVSSFPGGILSALIIGIGLHQAWSMTGAHKLTVSGPYKVGSGHHSLTG